MDTFVICRVTPDIGLSRVSSSCVSAELLADQIVRLELLAKLSARYKTIQSVTKRYIVAVAPNCYSTVYFADCRFYMGIQFDLGYQFVELWFVMYIGLWALEEPSSGAWIFVLRLWFVVLLRCG